MDEALKLIKEDWPEDIFQITQVARNSEERNTLLIMEEDPTKYREDIEAIGVDYCFCRSLVKRGNTEELKLMVGKQTVLFGEINSSLLLSGVRDKIRSRRENESYH